MDNEINNPIPQPQNVNLNNEKPGYGFADFISSIICFVLTYFLIHSVKTGGLTPTWITTAVYLGFFVLATLYIVLKYKKFPIKALFPGLLAVVSSFSFALHYNEILNGIIFIMVMYLSGSYCIALTDSNIHSSGSFYYLLDVLRCELIIPFKNIALPIKSFFGYGRNREKGAKKDTKKILPAIIGVVVAIPVLAIIIPLLVKSDAAFAGVFSSFFLRLGDVIKAFFRQLFSLITFDVFSFIFALIFTPYIFSVMFSFRHGNAKDDNKDTSEKYRKLRVAPTAFFAAFLSVISLVYVIYLFSQATYFFSGFSGKLPSGVEITVTEYARRGFFELVEIAAINFVLVALTVAISKRTDNKIPNLIKGFDTFLCIFTMLVCAISISKILLYINEFGLTEKRVYVFVADIVLILIFIAIILRLFIEKFPYMRIIVGSVCVALTLLGLVGVKNYIAKYNTEAYVSGKLDRIDTAQLYSFDGIGVKYLKLIADSDTEYSKVAQMDIDDYINEYFEYNRFNRDKTCLDDFKERDFFDEYIANLPKKQLLNASTAYAVLKWNKTVKSVAVSFCGETVELTNEKVKLIENYKLFNFKFDEANVLEKLKSTDDLEYTYTITFITGKKNTFTTKSNMIRYNNFAIFDYDFEDYGVLMSKDDVKQKSDLIL